MNTLQRFGRIGGLAALLVLGSLAVAQAGPPVIGPLTLVSVPPNPFAGCTAGATGSSTLYPNAEVEPWVDANPTNANNLIAVWQQDRWSDGGAHGLATGVSHDGGATWQPAAQPHFSLCAGGTPQNGGNYERASDPWVSIGPDGVAYQISLSFDATTARNAVLTSHSTDGGVTWSEPITIKADSGDRDASYAFNDKESITADPTRPGYAYAVWDRFVTPGGKSQASLAGLLNSRAFRQPIWFARTTNGGASWEPARLIYDRSSQNGTIGNQVVVLPNGDLVDIFDEFFVNKNSDQQRGASVAVIRSTDAGLTWQRKSIVVSQDLAHGAVDPDTGRPIRAEGGIPDIAVDRANGTLYATWQDSRFRGVDEVALAVSTDGGFTWSAPIKVNQTPANANSLNQQAFVPAVHVADDGTVAVTYYDFRNNTDAVGAPTDYWIVHCHPAATGGCASATNWGNEARLSDSSFDIEQAPAARGPYGYFVGDYEGLTNIGADFLPVFVLVNNNNTANPTDVFSRHVTSGAALQAAGAVESAGKVWLPIVQQ